MRVIHWQGLVWFYVPREVFLTGSLCFSHGGIPMTYSLPVPGYISADHGACVQRYLNSLRL